MSLENKLWVEKYRPQTIDEYVGNDDFISKIRHWIQTGDIPNMILYSEKSGTGKTSLCKLLAKSIDADILYINASSENGIDTVRDKITSFANSVGFSEWKILILDEFSFFSLSAQSALNNIIESTSKHTRFFLTGNYINKFLPSIVSRCNTYKIESPPPKQVFANISSILERENIEFDPKDLIKIIKTCYPDQRAMISYCQDNSFTGRLVFSQDQLVLNDYCSKILEELKNRTDVKQTFTNIRQIIADSKVKQFDELFKFLFEKLDEFVPDGKKAQTILHIADAQTKSLQVIDAEIQVAAMIVNILNTL